MPEEAFVRGKGPEGVAMVRQEYTPQEKWEILVEAFGSPLGPAEVCNRRGVSLGQLRSWLQVARRAALDAFAGVDGTAVQTASRHGPGGRTARRVDQASGRRPLRKPFSRPVTPTRAHEPEARAEATQEDSPTSRDSAGSMTHVGRPIEPNTGWSTEEIDAVFSRTSHELREPLRGMQAIGRFLLEDFGDLLPDKAKAYLKALDDTAERMRQQLIGLSEYARCTRRITHLRPCCLVEVLRHVRTTLRPFVTQRHGTVVIDSRLPVVLGDPTALGTAFGHLIRNGITYCEAEAPKVQVVAVDAGADDRCARIEVRDNGIGIDSRYHEAVFDLFYRLHSYEAYPGAGVGLSVVRRIIQAHQGRVAITSSSDQGTCFTIELPRALEP